MNAFKVFKDVAALMFPSLDMAGVREHVKNRQGNHFVALQDFTNQKSIEIRGWTNRTQRNTQAFPQVLQVRCEGQWIAGDVQDPWERPTF